MSGTQLIRWLAACKWAPLIIVLALQMRLMDSIYIAGAYLLIPVVVHLAMRYGKDGWFVVALSGILLLGRVSIEAVSSTPAVGPSTYPPCSSAGGCRGAPGSPSCLAWAAPDSVGVSGNLIAAGAAWTWCCRYRVV